ncbi:MAG: BNR-4 repeat-containing protein [Dysgonamonadaceae bacterium]|nr:BNR-4 repeat-containing protein [Dysgonamonadaceae bacterium]
MKQLYLVHTLIFTLLFITQIAYSQQAAIPGNNYKTFTDDGSWCWFSDPRAVYYKDKHERTYVGAVSSEGDIKVGYYDHTSGETIERVITARFQSDDHVNPSLLFLPDGRLMIFYTGHNGGFYYTKTLHSEDITQWEEVKTLDMGKRLCYTNPVLLSEENNRLYLFSRGGYDWKPSYIYSDDLGDTWSKPQTIVSVPNAPISNRPYTKVLSDGKSTIWFAITDGHPRDEPLNSIYVFYYKESAFYQTDGKLLATINNLPFDQNLIHKAYDANETKVRSWIWDLKLDEEGFPRIVYTRLKDETTHTYYYAAWNEKEWKHTFVSNAGQDFLREKRNKEVMNREPHYSGGIVLDDKSIGLVYYSKPIQDRFEIIRAELSNDGVKWNETAITQNSVLDNVRPFIVRNSPPSIQPRLFWMNNLMYKHYTNYRTMIKMDISPSSDNN